MSPTILTFNYSLFCMIYFFSVIMLMLIWSFFFFFKTRLLFKTNSTETGDVMRLTAELCSGWTLGFSGFTSNTPTSPEDGLGPTGVQRSTSDSPLVSCHQSRRPAGSPWGPTWLHWLHSEGEREREHRMKRNVYSEQSRTEHKTNQAHSVFAKVVWRS